MCRLDKEREHAAALEVLPDLLNELDQMQPRARLTSLIQGILAGNIFDWGAKATVDLYHNGTILEIYRYCCVMPSQTHGRQHDRETRQKVVRIISLLAFFSVVHRRAI